MQTKTRKKLKFDSSESRYGSEFCIGPRTQHSWRSESFMLPREIN